MLALLAAAATGHWPVTAAAAGLLAVGAALWAHGAWYGGRAVVVFDAQARELGLTPCDPYVWRTQTSSPGGSGNGGLSDEARA